MGFVNRFVAHEIAKHGGVCKTKRELISDETCGTLFLIIVIRRGALMTSEEAVLIVL